MVQKSAPAVPTERIEVALVLYPSVVPMAQKRNRGDEKKLRISNRYVLKHI